MRRWSWLLFASLAVVSVTLACQALSGLPAEPVLAPTPEYLAPTPFPGESSSFDSGYLASEDRLVQLYEKVSQGVVAIRVLTQQGEALGSGFVYDTQGHILTNYHVVEGYNELEIDFPSGLKVRGEIIGKDLDSDIAVIKVEASEAELFPLPLGDSDLAKVGQTVIAIGNPFGLSGTMTLGIISAKGRTLASMREAPGGSFFTAGDLIQTDTAINPGNSGGPLINLDGEVIGINRAIRTENFSTSGDPVNTGIGFAVPINMIKRVVPGVIETGSFDYPYLGISSTENISLLVQEALDLPQSSGAYVAEVTAGSPAYEAGLRGGNRQTDIPGLLAGGDLIIAVDGQPVNNFGDMLTYLIKFKSPGDVIALTILRENNEMEVNLTLGKRP